MDARPQASRVRVPAFPPGAVARLYRDMPPHLHSHGTIVAFACRPRDPALMTAGRPLSIVRFDDDLAPVGGTDSVKVAQRTVSEGGLCWFSFATLDAARRFVRDLLPHYEAALLPEHASAPQSAE